MVRILTITMSFYWLMFWLLNGLDKVFHGKDLGLFKWAGKNRENQFTGYMDGLGWSQEVIPYLMVILFIVELIIAFFFARVIFQIWSKRNVKRYMPQENLKLPILLSILMFTAFSVWDVVVGDRAELLEHGTYVVAIGITWVIASLEAVLDVIPETDYEGSERRSATMDDRRADVKM